MATTILISASAISRAYKIGVEKGLSGGEKGPGREALVVYMNH